MKWKIIQIFSNRLIRRQGEDVMPQITYDETIKENVLDNSLKSSDKEICDSIRRECNEKKLKATKVVCLLVK